MIATVEMSLYPLKENYEEQIIDFIKILKENDSLTIKTTAMSTYVKGELSVVMDAISNATEMSAENFDTFSLVLKIIPKSLPIEIGYLDFD